MSAVNVLELVLALLAAAVLLSLLADKLRLPAAVPLVVAGIVFAVMPGTPALELEPGLILVLFLPPLLLHAAYFTVWRDFKAEFRAIGMLSLGAVFFTTLTVGLIAHLTVPALPWPCCFALGAIVSPPDAVSARAIFQRLKIPRRMQTILEGESLVNDASGLVLYRFAVVAALSGTFTVSTAALTFVWLTVSGISFGLLVGGLVEIFLRRLRDSKYIIVTTLLSAYASYLGAEALQGSGVLAVVSCGLYVGWRQHELLDAEARSDSHSAWGLIVFILEALVFVLIGLSLHAVVERIAGKPHAWDAAIPLALGATATVISSRFVWIYATSYLSRIDVWGSSERESPPPSSVLLIMSWSGMRGVVSLAAALALPQAIPERDPLLFATFVVIVVTVLLQGVTLGPLIRFMRVSELPIVDKTLSFSEARVKVNVASLQALETLVNVDDGGLSHPELVKDYQNRTRATERLRDEDETIGQESHAHFQAALTAVETGRAELIRLLHEGDIHDSVAHQIETDLDLEEMRLKRLAEALPGETDSVTDPAKEPSGKEEFPQVRSENK